MTPTGNGMFMRYLMMLIVGNMILVSCLAETAEIGGICWTYSVNEDGTAKIGTGRWGGLAVPQDTEGELDIPNFIENHVVVSVGAYAFRDCNKITRVNFSDAIVNVEEGAFSGCKGLEQVSMNVGLRNIDYGAFGSCSTLRRVDIPDTVTTIGSYSFSWCSSVETLSLGRGLKEIKSSAFSNCSVLEQVVLPESVEMLGDNVFNGTRYFNEHQEGLVVSGKCVLGYKGKMPEEFILPNNVKVVADGAFSMQNDIRTVVWPGSVRRIGERMFYWCTSLEEVRLAEGVQSIGNSAFADCSNLRLIALPSSIERIEDMAFRGCKKLGDGIVISGNWLLQVNGNCPANVEVEEGVRGIVGGAFSEHGEVVNIVLPSTLKHIGGSSFSSCSGLLSISIPIGVETIGAGAFRNCSKLLSIKLPDGLLEMGESTFDDCVSLKELIVPSSLKCLRDATCYGCSSLTNLVLRDGLEAIQKGCFTDCSSLHNVVIPQTVTNDIYGAFSYCSGLTNVVIKGGIKELAFPFYACSSLRSIYIADSVRSIPGDTFEKCGSLAAVHFMGDAPKMGRGVFSDVSSSCVAYVKFGSVGWNTLIPGSWEGIDITYEVPESIESWVESLDSLHGSGSKGRFLARYGDDLSHAWDKLTDKQDGAGNPMFVWQDYVAGTDPTDETDVFTASITIVDGKVKVSYTPELDDARKALRKYTTWGKVKLTDKDWSIVGEGEEGNFNFFKVTVEMK